MFYQKNCFIFCVDNLSRGNGRRKTVDRQWLGANFCLNWAKIFLIQFIFWKPKMIKEKWNASIIFGLRVFGDKYNFFEIQRIILKAMYLIFRALTVRKKGFTNIIYAFRHSTAKNEM